MADRAEVGVTKVQITWEQKEIVRLKKKLFFHQFLIPFIYTSEINVWKTTERPL